MDRVIDVRAATVARDGGTTEAQTVRATRARLLSRRVACRALDAGAASRAAGRAGDGGFVEATP